MIRKLLLSAFSLMLSFSGFAQIEFEKGYFINNAGQRKDCLIKNMDWKDSPTSFLYKASASAQEQSANIDDVSEFGVAGYIKYVRSEVQIDRSSFEVSRLSTNRHPEYVTETLFLRQIIEGTVDLYLYEEGNLRRYYFRVDKEKIEPLVYKKYKRDRATVHENNMYKQQLLNALSCEGLSKDVLERLSYNKASLSKFYVRYYQCSGENYVHYDAKISRDLFNFRVRPGLKVSSLSIQNHVLGGEEKQYGTKLNYRLGAELEFVMPFKKGKWALVVEPTYQQYYGEENVDNRNSTAEYKSIELPFGVRHYFFLNDQDRVFLNVSYVVDQSFNSSIKFESSTYLDVQSRNNIAIGAGVLLRNRFMLELKYDSPRHILSDYLYWDSKYSSFSFILGYQLF